MSDSRRAASLLPVLRRRGPPAGRGDDRAPGRCRACAHVFSVSLVRVDHASIPGEPRPEPSRRPDMTTTASRVERDLDEIRRLAAEGAALVGAGGHRSRARRLRAAGRDWPARRCAGPPRPSASTSPSPVSMGDEVLVHLVGTTDPRRRRVLPRHRLPLRRDPRHPRRLRGHAADPDPDHPAAADRRRSRTRSTAPKLHDRDPDRAARMRKVEPLNRALSTHRAWVTGMRRVDAPTRTDIAIVGWDDKRRAWSSSTPSPAGPTRTSTATSQEHGVFLNPLRQERIRLDRLRALHPPRRRGRGRQGRPLGRPGQDRMRAAHMTALVDRPVACPHPAVARPPRPPRVRGDPHLPRGRGRVRAAGDPVLAAARTPS